MMAEMRHTRFSVWVILFDLEWNIRYYSEKSDSFEKRAFWLRLALLFSIIFEALVVYVVASYSWSLWVAVGITMIVAALALWDVLSDYRRQAAILTMVKLDCITFQNEAETLWRQIETYSIDPDEAERAYQSIYSRWARVTERVWIRDDDALSRRCAADASEVIQDKYIFEDDEYAAAA